MYKLFGLRVYRNDNSTLDHTGWSKRRNNKILSYIRCPAPLNIVEKWYFHSFLKMAAGGHFGCLKFILFAFLTISDKKATLIFFAENGRRQPFWMSEINFCLHFWTFQIKTQLSFFFTKWPPVAILDVRNSFSLAFLVISDENATFIFFHKMAAGGHFGCPK